jgi:hypothetical protein
MPFHVGHGLLKPVLQEAAIGETGQPVVIRQVAGLRLLVCQLNKFLL